MSGCIQCMKMSSFLTLVLVASVCSANALKKEYLSLEWPDGVMITMGTVILFVCATLSMMLCAGCYENDVSTENHPACGASRQSEYQREEAIIRDVKYNNTNISHSQGYQQNHQAPPAYSSYGLNPGGGFNQSGPAAQGQPQRGDMYPEPPPSYNESVRSQRHY